MSDQIVFQISTPAPSSVEAISTRGSKIDLLATNIAAIDGVYDDINGADNVGTVAADLLGSNYTGQVAGNIANVNIVAGMNADIATVIDAIPDIEALTTRVGDAEADIISEQQARSSADAAIVSDVTALTTRVGDAEADIVSEQTARANGDSALTSSLNALTTRVGTTEADIIENATAISDETSARVSLASQLSLVRDNLNAFGDPYLVDALNSFRGTIGTRTLVSDPKYKGGKALRVRSNTLTNDQSEFTIPVSADKTYRLESGFWLQEKPADGAWTYLGVRCLDINGNSTGGNFGRIYFYNDDSDTLEEGDYYNAVTTFGPNGDYQFHAGTVAIQLAMYTGNFTTDYITVDFDHFEITDITDVTDETSSRLNEVSRLDAQFKRGETSLNLVRNGYFTYDPVGTVGTPSSWTDWIGGSACTIDQDPNNPDRAVLHMDAGSDTSNFGVRQTVNNITSGATYTVTARVRRQGGTFAAAGVNVEFRNASNVFISTTKLHFAVDGNLEGADALTPDGVVTYSKTVTAPAGSTHLNVYLMAAAAGIGSNSAGCQIDWLEFSVKAADAITETAIDAKADAASALALVATETAALDARIDEINSAAAYIVADTISEMQNLTGAEAEDVVRLLGRASAGDGAEGLFYWVAGDQSSNVTTDEVTASAGNGGIWVAPSTDLTGASGAWKRANIDEVSVKWYGAVGDNTADDTDAVQAAIAGANSVSSKTVYFPAGTYKCDEQLILNSGARWIGDGPALSTVKFDSGLGNNIAIRTATTSGTINDFDQSNIELIGLHIQGFDAVLTATASEAHAPLTRFWKIDGLNIERCKFSGHRYIMLSLGGVVNAEIRGCEFADWGRTDDLASSGTLPANEGGAAIWIGANPIDNTTSRNVSIHHNYFHDSQWSAVYMFGDHLDFSFNRVIDTKEGIYSRSTDSGTNNDSTQLTFIGNHIKGVTERFIQASGFECGSKGAIISGNTIEDCEGPGIDLADTCETTIVSGNILTDCVTAAGFASYAAISIRSTTTTADVIDGITVTGNIIRGASSYYGIRLYRVSGSDSFSNIHVYGNDLVGSASSSNNYLTYDASQFGSNVALYQNQGASDYAVSATWSSTISASSGTLTTTSTPTARYWQDGPTVNFTITITLTDIGTGSGNLRFTLPTTPAYSGACVGRNAANGKALAGTWGATTTVNCNYYDATFPAISGHTIRISGQYFAA